MERLPAMEVKPFNINVVVVEPGGIASEFGDIMYKPLIERSKGGAYEAFSAQIADFYKKQFEHPEKLSSPKVISETVSKIVKAKKPKTRYAAGKGSKAVIFMKWLLSDKMFDKFIMSAYRT